MAQNSLAEAVPLTTKPQRRQHIEQPKPRVQPQPQGQPQKLPVSKFEKCLVTLCGLALAVMMVCVVSSKIAMSNAQHDLQSITQTTATIQSRNTNAQQEINELQSRSRLDKIAQKQGLTLDNARIRTVNK